MFAAVQSYLVERERGVMDELSTLCMDVEEQ